MKRPLPQSKDEMEDALAAQLDEKRLFDLFLPAIKEIIKSGGGAEAILKNSEALAATRLMTTALKGREEAALKAATAILDRTLGRPVERRLNVYADVAEMSDEQLDREIFLLAKRAGVKEEVIEILAEPSKGRTTENGFPTGRQPVQRTSMSAHPDGSKPSINYTRRKKKRESLGEGRDPSQTPPTGDS